MFKIVTTLATMAALAALAATAQAQQQAPEVTTYDLGSGIYALFGRGGNVGISVGEDGVYMIDDQFAPMSESLQAAIAEITDEPIRYVLNTHWHGDHTGGNQTFKAGGAIVVAHENVRIRMAEGLDDPRRGNPVAPEPPEALPHISLTDGAIFHFNDLDVRIIHVPNAHTDGDIIVVFEGANVIHMGDIFFNGRYPFVDIFSDGTIDGTIAGLALGLEFANEQTRIIPGHGEMATRDDLQAAHDMLVEVRSRIAAAIDEGMSADEVVEADLLTDLNATFGQAFISGEIMARTAHASIVWANAQAE